MITSHREQYVYGGTVHLFKGTGPSPDQITFVSLITSYNHDMNYQGLNGLFLFKSVLPFVSDVSSCRSSLDYSFSIYLLVVHAWIWPCWRCFCLEDLRRRRRPPTVDPSWCYIVFRNELDPQKIRRLWNVEGPKNTFPELIAEKRLKYSERKVAHHAASMRDLAIHLCHTRF